MRPSCLCAGCASGQAAGGDQDWTEGLTQTADAANQYVQAVSRCLVAVARDHLDAKGEAVLLGRLALECHRPQGCLQVQGQQSVSQVRCGLCHLAPSYQVWGLHGP